MHKKNIRALSLIVCTFTYLMMGAAVFDSLESGEDMKRRQTLRHLEKKMRRKYNFSDQDYQLLETVVVKGIPHKAGLQWKFAGAFYFATVVITTVGYGHSTPATPQGRAFCMLYAAAGIPLGLVMFQSIGERLNTLISFILHRLKHHFQVERKISSSHLIFVSSSVGGGIMMIGTYVFHKKEGWSLYDAYYYCFITMTTIGFGDYVALQTDGTLSMSPGYVVFTLVFILFGLAVFSASVNLFVLKFMATAADDAAHKEPPKSVLLETFARGSQSSRGSSVISVGVDEIAMGERGDTPNGSIVTGRKVSVLNPKLSTHHVPQLHSRHEHQQLQHHHSAPSQPFLLRKSSKGKGSKLICMGNCQRQEKEAGELVVVKGRRGNKKRGYVVRRGPTRISHLLMDYDDHTLPHETDSFILHDIQQRRGSF